MNKLLVTGLGLGSEFDVCSVCNSDLDWIMEYPSTLLWADKIIFTPKMWDSIHEEYSDNKEAAKCFKLIFDIAKTNGIIEILDPSTIIDDSLHEMIDTQIEKDIVLLRTLFPKRIQEKSISKTKDVKLVETVIDGVGYCPPYLWAIYASIILARKWNANCLFNARSLHFCKYKFGISSFPRESDVGAMHGFAKLFNSFLPNDSFFHNYGFMDKKLCNSCKSIKKCKDSYLLDIENKVLELFEWRKYDEIHQMKSVINRIASKQAKSNGLINPEHIIKEFDKEKSKIQKRMMDLFPKVKRWANITTILSIPVAVAGLAISNPFITVTGGATAGLSQTTKELIEFFKSKYQWVGFTSENINKKTMKKIQNKNI